VHRQMFDDGTKAVRRKSGRRDQDHATTRPTNNPPSVGKVPADTERFSCAQRSAIASIGMTSGSGHEHRRPSVAFQNGTLAEDRRSAAVIAGGGNVGIQRLTEPCGPALFSAPCNWQRYRQRGEAEHDTAGSGCRAWPFDLFASSFLRDIPACGRPSVRPRTSHDDEQQHAVKAEPTRRR